MNNPNWGRRPPPFHNTISFLIFLVLAIIGGAVGSLVGGEPGARMGFVVLGVSALMLPYRRWLAQIFSWYRNKSK